MTIFKHLKLLDRMTIDRRFRLPRLWSNDILRSVAPLLEGDVINVSAWNDEDKQGGHYRDYFTKARSYTTSNYGGYRGGIAGDAIELNLESELPPGLHARFDVVYNHTTLEHVFDVFGAVKNLCLLSRDLVIVVVPYVQEVHTGGSFSDYWRFTSLVLRRLFEVQGLEVVLLTSSPRSDAAIYHFCVASRHPERWRDRLGGLPSQVNDGEMLFRPSRFGHFLSAAARRLARRR